MVNKQSTLNVKKSNFIVFKSRSKKLKKDLHIKLNNKTLERVKQTKFLGIIVDEHLTWKDHIDYVTLKIIRICGILRRIRFFLNQSTLKLLYYSLIYPYLHYGNIVWANNFPTRLENLFKLQKKILRIITFSPYNTPSLPLFNKLEILNIHQINDLLISSFSYNLVNNALPPYFKNFCIINAELHNYHTRSSRKLHKTFNRTNYSVYSTRNKVINTWNNIPAPIKQSNSVFIFNKNMKKFLISGA